jgi:hypothetical protein
MSGILNMLLAGGVRIVLNSATYSHDNPGGAGASFAIRNDGFVYAADSSSGGVATQRYQWCFPAALAASFDVRWNTTANVVDTTPGAENTNLNLGTNRTWSEANASALETCSFQARIHRAGDTATPLATANITLEADGSP